MPPLNWCGYCLILRCAIRDADLLETPHRFLARRRAVHAKVQLQRLGQLAPDRENRVQRGHRLLIDHGDLLAADVADLGVGQLQQVLTVEDDLAADDLAGRVRDQAHDRQGADALAAAALADKAQRLSLFDLIRDAIDRLHHAGLGEEMGP